MVSIPRHGQVVLLASAHSYRMQPFMEAAEDLGIEVVQALDIPDRLPQAAVAQLAINYRHWDEASAALVAYARQHPVAAFLGLDDSGTLLAAQASAAIGLPYNDPGAARAAHDKYLMRQLFAQHDVPSPDFRLASVHDRPEELAPLISYPCVLKPTTLAGSQGVMRADNAIEFHRRFLKLQQILANQSCHDILIEDYIPGIEVALEGLLADGHLHLLALFDKPDPLEGPYFEETIYVTPSRLPEKTQARITAAAAQAAAALGLRQGPVHAELRLNEAGPWLVEIAGRSIGGLCSRTLRFGIDASLESLILKQAVGMDLGDLQRERDARGVMMIPIPARGLYAGVQGVESALQIPGIESIEITAQMHYPVRPVPEGDSYLGFIFARGATPTEVESSLRRAHALLQFTILPQMELMGN